MIFILALLLRAPALGQSLWYDEIVTLFNYVLQPWSAIVKGQYSPNNHILFSLLAKLITPENGDVGDITILLRLPSFIAGALVPITPPTNAMLSDAKYHAERSEASWSNSVPCRSRSDESAASESARA